jgi:glutathione S-transferase
MIQLYHHPFSRAAGVLWTLEEVGEPYELIHVDILKGAQKSGDVIAKNPMGKVPLLVDGDAIVTEAAAIALYLADRYAHGRLAPKLDDPRRGTYLRWTLFAPSVIEPGATAKLNNWQAKPSQVGWGDFASMLTSIDAALDPGPFICGEMFTIADVVFGGTLRYMTMFKMLTASPAV